MHNPNKTYHCTATGIYSHYTNERKHFFIPYEKKSFSPSQTYRNNYKGKSYKDFEDNRFTYEQNKMYQKCLYGIKICSPAEVKKMSFAEKVTINFNHKRTQQLINLSKWKADCDLANSVIKSFFKKIGTNIQWLLSSTDNLSLDDNNEINYGSMSLFGGKEQLINKLIEESILPTNFYNLK